MEKTKNRAHSRSRNLRLSVLKLGILRVEVLPLERSRIQTQTSPPDLDTTPQSNVEECRQESNVGGRQASRTSIGLCPVVGLHDRRIVDRDSVINLYDAESQTRCCKRLIRELLI